MKRSWVRVAATAWMLLLFLGAGVRLLADCSAYGLPFADLASETVFCGAIAEAYYTGLTNGTSATTFSPSQTVTREQMAAFTTRTLDSSLRRGSRRAALGRWWTPSTTYFGLGAPLGATALPATPVAVVADGADIWVSHLGGVSRVRASDGRLLGTWTGPANPAYGILVALGRVFFTEIANGLPGKLWMIDPTTDPGAATLLTSGLAVGPEQLAFDGAKIWIACNSGAVSIVTPGSWNVISVQVGFSPGGLLFDGSNVWVVDRGGSGSIDRLDSAGNVLNTAAVGGDPLYPAFDGENIWVPSSTDDSVTVVRAVGSSPAPGTVITTLTGNGLNLPWQAAFDGQRVLVSNETGDSVSLWNATTLAPIGTVPAPGLKYGVCSDGIDFWIALASTQSLGRL